MKTVNEIIKNIDTKEFMKQKEWLAEQISALEPSGTEATRYPEGLLHLLDEIQDAAEEELAMDFKNEMKTFQVPFAYERYGRMSIVAPANATLEEIHELAEKKMREMSVGDMDECTDYLTDSKEIDLEGIILDDEGNRADLKQDSEPFGIVMITKEGIDGLSQAEIKELLAKVGPQSVYPIELQAYYEEKAVMGFITQEAASILHYDYEKSGLHTYMSSILEFIELKHEDNIYEFKGIRIWLDTF